MKLIIGGYAQGKLDYVRHHYFVKEPVIYEGELPTGIEQEEVVIYRFHQWLQNSLKRGEVAEDILWKYLKENPKVIIISDEVGNGIVPMENFEREYRERLGRILIELAEDAEEVIRVICGIGQKIK